MPKGYSIVLAPGGPCDTGCQIFGNVLMLALDPELGLGDAEQQVAPTGARAIGRALTRLDRP